MDPVNNPNDKASNNPEHDPSHGATVGDQQANAAREDQGKPFLSDDADHSLHSEEDAKKQAAVEPIANPVRPTTSPASAQQTSANLLQTTTVGELGGPAVDGKCTGTITVHFVVQPNDARSEQAIVFAALSDEYNKLRGAGF